MWQFVVWTGSLHLPSQRSSSWGPFRMNTLWQTQPVGWLCRCSATYQTEGSSPISEVFSHCAPAKCSRDRELKASTKKLKKVTKWKNHWSLAWASFKNFRSLHSLKKIIIKQVNGRCIFSIAEVSYLGHEVHDRQLYIFLEYMPEGRFVGFYAFCFFRDYFFLLKKVSPWSRTCSSRFVRFWGDLNYWSDLFHGRCPAFLEKDFPEALGQSFEKSESDLFEVCAQRISGLVTRFRSQELSRTRSMNLELSKRSKENIWKHVHFDMFAVEISCATCFKGS